MMNTMFRIVNHWAEEMTHIIMVTAINSYRRLLVPVYFKFGKNPATIEQAFRQTYDDLYGIQTLPAKVAPNAWGYTFPEIPWDAENFDELPPYYLVDRINNVAQDR